MLKKERLTKEDITKHFCEVNKCTEIDFQKHKDEAFKIWNERTKHQWKQDFGKYRYFIEEPREEKKPSNTDDVDWIYAESKKDYPASTENSGKWLIFGYLKYIDEVWNKISVATEEGKLGNLSKCGTAKRNPSTAVICVYTYDSEDRADVARIAWELFKIGVVQKQTMNYKTDNDTTTRKYAHKGDKKISKYSIRISDFNTKTEEEFCDFFKEKYKHSQCDIQRKISSYA